MRDPEYQRELLAAAYEEEGAEGFVEVLREIARATNLDASPMNEITPDERSIPELTKVRATLNALGLDFTVITKPTKQSRIANPGGAV